MNIAIIGSKGLGKELGKRGTTSDITLYNLTFQGKNYTFIEPEKYPEKIQTMFQAINMSNFVILFVSKDIEKKILGECILAIDILKLNGIIVLDGFEENELKNIISNTNLKNFPIMEKSFHEIIKHLESFNVEIVSDEPKVLVDHAFQVKSVGTVILGTVISGEIKKYDVMKIFPQNKEVMIKSIQINDKDFENAKCFDRVGLALKGIEVDEIQRGDIIGKNIECINEINVKIEKNIFYKGDAPTNVMCLVGLQYINSKMFENKISFDKKIAFNKEKVIILTPDKPMRIFGIAISE
ncbi:MAG: EF-Tu/IF-2/RF-3 family GTPase [Candidatus Aenigmatarchaeota archaeon]|nr:hypothetical protein [Candidatus Aenigmarchaeota archaeon]